MEWASRYVLGRLYIGQGRRSSNGKCSGRFAKKDEKTLLVTSGTINRQGSGLGLLIIYIDIIEVWLAVSSNFKSAS